jgi:hypothetical protein
MRIQDSSKSKLVQRRALTGAAGRDAFKELDSLGAGALIGRVGRKSAVGLPLLNRPVIRRQATLERNGFNRFRF